MVKRTGKRFLNKKGSLIDILFIGVVLFFFSMVAIVGLKVSSEINDNIQDSNIFNDRGKTATNQAVESYTKTIDNTFLMFTVLLGMITLVLAAMVRIHPIFIPFYFIGLVFVIIFSAIISNIYEEMAANAQLLSTAQELTFITNILSILPIIVGIFGIALMIIMYKIWDAERI